MIRPSDRDPGEGVMKAVPLGIPRSNFTEITPLFEKHAAPEAIEAAIISVTARRNRLNRQLEKLQALHAKRLAQIDAGEWPGRAGAA